MMAEKARTFRDIATLEKILATNEPLEAKRLGRAVAGFDDEVWRQVRFDIVRKANLHKFRQNVALGTHLTGTGRAILVEASPADRVWGIGLAASD
ncbi:MAG: NADAR family protein, partial [Casimicrobiaceae bacterium]